MSEGIEFKKIGFTKKDISQIVKVHRQEIQQGFLSSLGDKALEMIFSLASESDFGILITAKDVNTGCTCGFVCGTTHTGAFYKDFLRRRFFQGIVYFVPKLLSPTKLWKAMETLIYPAKKEVIDMPRAELLIIAVDNAYKGSGIAQTLFYELIKAFKNKGVTTFKVVAGRELVRAQRFYQKLGPTKVDSIQVHRGQSSLVYMYDIVDQGEPLNEMI
jgi:ribosomal protein S18 acetylase RimI-like enzyme